MFVESNLSECNRLELRAEEKQKEVYSIIENLFGVKLMRQTEQICDTHFLITRRTVLKTNYQM